MKRNRITILFISLVIALSLCIPGLSRIENQRIPQEEFAPSAECGECHQKAFNEWKGSIHSLSHFETIYQTELNQARKEAGPDMVSRCSVCHTPLAVVGGLTPYSDEASLPLEVRRGIGCDFCHTIDGSISGDDYSYRLNPGNVKYGPNIDAMTDAHDVKYSEFMRDPRFCAICHDSGHLFGDKKTGGTYTEWKNSSYNKGSIEKSTTCQDCHMSPGLDHFQAEQGRSAVDGPVRNHVSSHNFTAANTALPGLIGTAEHNMIAAESLKKAAKIKVIGSLEADAGSVYTFYITVTNRGAGHCLPTGLPATRQMWLAVTVYDSKTWKPLYTDGDLDSTYSLDPGCYTFNAEYVDKNGDPTDKTWEQVDIIDDRRIKPGETVTRKYRFRIPEDFKGPMAIVAVLRYRSASMPYTDRLFGKGQKRLAVVEMASYIHANIEVK
jgi:hypothetical protein